MDKFRKIIGSKAFVYIFIVFIFALILFFRSGFIFSKDKIVNESIKNIATELAVLAIVCFAFCKKQIFEFAGLNVKPKALLWSLPCFLVALANFPFSALLSGKAQILRADLIWIIALECLIVAITEELFFRAVVGNYLDKRISGKNKKFECIMLSAVIFGVWHLINLFGGAGLVPTLIQVVYTFLIGAMLSMLLITTKSLTLCIAVHAIFNFGGAVVERLGEGVIHDNIFWILTVLAGVFCFIFMAISYLTTEKPFAKPKA